MKWQTFDPGPKIDRRPQWFILGSSLRDEPVVEARTAVTSGLDWMALDQPVPLGAQVSAGPAGSSAVEEVDEADPKRVRLRDTLPLGAGTSVEVQIRNAPAQISRYIETGDLTGLDPEQAVRVQLAPLTAEDRDIVMARAGTYSTYGARVHESYIVALAALLKERPDLDGDVADHLVVQEMSASERSALAEYRAWALAYGRAIAAEVALLVKLPDGRTMDYPTFVAALRDPGDDVPNDIKAAMIRMSSEAPREIQAHITRMQEVAHRGKS